MRGDRRHQAALLARDGVLTRRCLVDAGIDPALMSQEVQAGRWTLLAPGIAVTGPGPASQVQRARAALVLAGPGAVLTGRTGCHALRLRYVPAGRQVDLLVPPHVRRVSGELVRVRRSASVVGLTTWTWHGMPVAEPTRCVADAAWSCPELRSVRALVLDAVHAGWTTVDALGQVLAAGPRNGSGLLRRALADAAAGAWSVPEAELADRLRGAVRDRDVPPFLLNAELLLLGRLLAVPDVWFPGLGLGVEMDSRQEHEGDGFDDTLRRHDRLAAHGLVLLHLTPRRLRAEPAQCLEAIVAAVAARQRQWPLEPSGLAVRPCGPLQQ